MLENYLLESLPWDISDKLPQLKTFRGSYLKLSLRHLYYFYLIGSIFNPIALRMTKTQWSFGHSEYSRVKVPSVSCNPLVCFVLQKKP